MYEHTLGTQTGDCKSVKLDREVKLEAVSLQYDTALRHLELRLSDGSI